MVPMAIMDNTIIQNGHENKLKLLLANTKPIVPHDRR